MKTVKRIVVIFFICLLCIEILLRITGVFKTSSERQGKGYISNYGEIHPTWYKNHKAYDTMIPPGSDFHYPVCTNKYGLREKDYSPYPADSVYRILITGNSYIEGMGAPYDSTWPRFLERVLKSKNMNVEVIDAGLAGNDILFDYVYYRDKLNTYYHPNLVIATMNTSDYIYYTSRGGMQRFRPDGTVHYLPIPWYDCLFHYSHLLRGILAVIKFPIEGSFLSKTKYAEETAKATNDFGKEIRHYSDEAHNNKAEFICIFYPKIQDLRYDWFLKNSLGNFNTLAGLLDTAAIPHFSLFKDFNKKFAGVPEKEYSYPRNGHYKPRGYQVLAQLTADSLIARSILGRR